MFSFAKRWWQKFTSLFTFHCNCPCNSEKHGGPPLMTRQPSIWDVPNLTKEDCRHSMILEKDLELSQKTEKDLTEELRRAKRTIELAEADLRGSEHLRRRLDAELMRTKKTLREEETKVRNLFAKVCSLEKQLSTLKKEQVDPDRIKELEEKLSATQLELQQSEQKRQKLERESVTAKQMRAKREIRNRRFPWLSEEKRARSWDRLPAEVMQKILRLLPDEDLFEMKKLSSDFYEAYYSQEVAIQGGSMDVTACSHAGLEESPFNFERAFGLAVKGRSFPRLQQIWCFLDELDDPKKLDALSPERLPKLRKLRLTIPEMYMTKERPLPEHPGVQSILFDYGSGKAISRSLEAYRSLTTFAASFHEPLDYPDHPPHNSLRSLELVLAQPGSDTLPNLTPDRLPNLESLWVYPVGSEVEGEDTARAEALERALQERFGGRKVRIRVGPPEAPSPEEEDEAGTNEILAGTGMLEENLDPLPQVEPLVG